MSEFSAIPEACPNCGANVVKKICVGCKNVFGSGRAPQRFKERRKNASFFPRFKQGEIDQLRRREDLKGTFSVWDKGRKT